MKTKFIFSRFLLPFCNILFILFWGRANNISVSNTSLTGRDLSAGVNNAANFSMIQFDLSWSNSWRSGAPNNHDAAWLFAKFRLGSADYLSAPGAINSGASITVNSTNGLRVGMPVFVSSGTGAFASGTVITAISSSTNFTVSSAPSTPLGNNAVLRAERIWEHCWLNNTGHSKGSIGSSASLQPGLQDETQAFHAVSNPALGAYFYRASAGSGNFSTSAAQLRWNYGAQGIRDNDIVDVKVIATEMVYVPTASHYIDTIASQAGVSLLLDGDVNNNLSLEYNIADSSSNNFSYTANSGVSTNSSSPLAGTSGSFLFSNSGGRVEFADNAALQMGTGDFTIEFWINFTDLSFYQSVFDKGYNSAGSLLFQTGNGNGRMTIWSGGSALITEAGTGTTGVWYHYALVRNGSSLTLYRDGIATGSTTNSTNFNNTSVLNLGDRTGAGTPFKGYLYNLRMVKGTAVYTANFSPPSTPLTNIPNTTLHLKLKSTSVANNNQFIDKSPNNLTVTRFGNTTQGSSSPFCNSGGSASFDGSGDYLQLPAGNAFSFSADFTIEFWVKTSSSDIETYYRRIFGTGPDASNALQLLYFNGSGASPNLGVFSNSMLITGTISAATGEWAHVALTRSGSAMRLFVNGIQSGSTATTSQNFNQGTTNNPVIGRYQAASGGHLKGELSNFRIVNGSALYTANFTPPSSPLTAISNTSLLLNFENAAIDDSRRKSALETVGDARISTAVSKFGGASIYFDGSGDNLSIQNPSSSIRDWNAGNYTLEAWVYLTANPTNSSGSGSPMIGHADLSPPGEYWSFGPRADRTVGLYYYNGGQNWLTTSFTINLNQWHHLAFVRSGSNLSIYIDGISRASAAISGTPLNSPLTNINIGRVAGGTFTGYIDDLRISSGTALYTSNFTPPTSAHTIAGSPSGYPISAESSIGLGGTNASHLRYSSPMVSIANDFNNSSSQTLPAAFPKGYQGFYCMKYEVSQQQWLNFFNSLTSVQKSARDITSSTGKNTDAISFRNNISWSSGDANLNSGTHGNVACNWLNWPDAAAYADWSGLRPMTELEFEKAARGIGVPQIGEPASGSSSCSGDINLTAASGISNGGAGSEVPSNSTANAVYGNQASVQGPCAPEHWQPQAAAGAMQEPVSGASWI